MTTRRRMIQLLVSTGLLPTSFAVGESSLIQVTTLEHHPCTHDKVRWTFASEKDAIEFVQSLEVELYRVEVKPGRGNRLIRSGYRGAVRYITPNENSVSRAFYRVVDKRTGCEVEISDFPLWESGYDACVNIWSALSNIRIDGKPVQRVSKSGGIPHYLSMPFSKAKDLQIITVEG